MSFYKYYYQREYNRNKVLLPGFYGVCSSGQWPTGERKAPEGQSVVHCGSQFIKFNFGHFLSLTNVSTFLCCHHFHHFET